MSITIYVFVGQGSRWVSFFSVRNGHEQADEMFVMNFDQFMICKAMFTN